MACLDGRQSFVVFFQTLFSPFLGVFFFFFLLFESGIHQLLLIVYGRIVRADAAGLLLVNLQCPWSETIDSGIF